VGSNIPGQEISYHSHTIYPSDKVEKSGDNFGILAIDHHFQEVFHPKLLSGQMFTYEDKTEGRKVVINREASRILGFDSPETALGKVIQVRVNDYISINELCLVTGVIEDFHQETLRKKIEPMILLKDYRWKYEVGFIGIRFDASGKQQDVISQLKQKWENFYPSDPFDFQYISETYKLQLKNDENLAMLSMIYTIFSIILATLGLYGLAANSARKRVKEIGIRKINGARVVEIMALLNVEFLKWITISFLIASPIAWYAMSRWLDNFAYKTTLNWWLFLIAGLLALGIALLTVTWQSLKAASMNPVEALRHE
jgi:putative ABC transport system permease protein